MSLPFAIEDLQSICVRAGRSARGRGRAVAARAKRDGSPVTAVDLAVEAQLRRDLDALTPGVAVIGEEIGGRAPAEGLAWVLDPIDGTRAFIAGIPTWTVSVGLLRDGVPVLGCVHLPSDGDVGGLFCGGVDVPLTRGGRPVSSIARDEAAPFCALVPSDTHRRYELRLPGRVRSLGSTALHLALVASGDALAALLHESYLWDVAGAMGLFRATDVRFAALDGAPLDLSPHLAGRRIDGPLLAAPSWAWDDLIARIRPRPVDRGLAGAVRSACERG